MFIEDLIHILSMSRAANLNSWDQKLVYSFSDQLGRGSGFTEKQGALALKIIKRHVAPLSTFLNKNIQQFIDNPTYKFPLRQINNTKRISIVLNSTYGKIVKVEFPYNEEYVNLIRKNKEDLGHAVWDKEEKAWIFSLTENNLRFLMDFASNENFQIDEEFENYSIQFNEVIKNMEQHVPMLVLDQGIPKFHNFSRNIPTLQSTDLLRSVFEARKYGIFTWDEEISKFIDSSDVDEFSSAFLKMDPSLPMKINSENTDISSISTIVKNMMPCLVLIPGGSELEKTQMAYTFSKNIGIEDHEISIMFRLPSDTDKGFNDFVKSSRLNSPISENTKMVFISSKLPKPVIKSKIKFHTIINLGYDNVHYSIRDFVGNHENLIYFSEQRKNKELSNWPPQE